MRVKKPRASTDGHHRGSCLAAKLFNLVGIEQQGFSGLDREDADLVSGAGVDRLGTEAGDIPSHIVVFLGDLDGDGGAGLAGQLSAAGEAGVGAFEALDGEDDALFDDDQLTDIEAGDFLGDAVAELDVFALFGGQGGAELEAGLGHEGGEPRGCLHQLDSLAEEFIGQGAEDGVGVLFLEFQEQAEGAEIGADVEQAFWGDLAGHDAAGDVCGFEGADEFGELSYLDPGDVVDEWGEGWIGFTFERDGDDPGDAHLACLAGQEEREGAVPGDQAQ